MDSSSSSDSSSDDEEILLLYLAHRQQCLPRIRSMYMAQINLSRNRRGEFSLLYSDLRTLSVEKHFTLFRMSKERFDILLEHIRPYITHKPNHRYPISPEQRLALTLRILAHGDSQAYIAVRDRVGQKTVNVIFNETCRAIWTALNEEFVAVPSLNELQEISKGFWELWNFPNCVGAIDGKHIAIKAPPNAGSRYYNYKNFHSIVLLAACDANYCFTFVDVGDWGRCGDAGTFANSAFGQKLLEESLPMPG